MNLFGRWPPLPCVGEGSLYVLAFGPHQLFSLVGKRVGACGGLRCATSNTMGVRLKPRNKFGARLTGTRGMTWQDDRR